MALFGNTGKKTAVKRRPQSPVNANTASRRRSPQDVRQGGRPQLASQRRPISGNSRPQQKPPVQGAVRPQQRQQAAIKRTPEKKENGLLDDFKIDRKADTAALKGRNYFEYNIRQKFRFFQFIVHVFYPFRRYTYL